jgi:hypothetical protein
VLVFYSPLHWSIGLQWDICNLVDQQRSRSWKGMTLAESGFSALIGKRSLGKAEDEAKSVTER